YNNFEWKTKYCQELQSPPRIEFDLQFGLLKRPNSRVDFETKSSTSPELNPPTIVYFNHTNTTNQLIGATDIYPLL
ncbi:hypothetical protein Ccrd_000149, partial [Cynara cardunculus var. scolymus]